jgi:hypothetical protein
LQRYIESPLSVQLLQGKFVKGDCVLIDVEEDKNELTFTKLEEFPVPDNPIEAIMSG